MRIRRHKASHIVELADGSTWRIWPADIPNTLQWVRTTQLDEIEIEHEICTHALIDRADGSHVRVIDAGARWPVDAVRRLLGDCLVGPDQGRSRPATSGPEPR